MNKKGLFVLILISVFTLTILAFALYNFSGRSDKAKNRSGNFPNPTIVEYKKSNKKKSFAKNYVAILYAEGVIEAENETYNQNFLLDTIDFLIEDPKNAGLLIFLDTPGGAVFESDEAYLKIREFAQKTNRPVFAYMASMACSGGYYIACAAEKIFANRNTLTGSIGVISGRSIDATEFFAKHGIKFTTIHSGKNKNMLSFDEVLTEEQKKILQSISDEVYEQFTKIVADRRNLPYEKVLRAADGRVYTAKQALEKNLIDEISSFDEALESLKKIAAQKIDKTEEQISVQNFRYEYQRNFAQIFRDLIRSANKPFKAFAPQNIVRLSTF